MSMNTPAGQIKYLTKHIKDFEDIEEMDGEQYLLGIQEIQRGVGGKVKLKDVITSTMSNDENNLLKKGTDDKLFAQDKAGDLEDLVTTNKDNLVTAINELSQKIIETGALSDIVSSYSDLMFYDTSRLNDGNIIQVLNDETHKGKTTYYKWVEESSSFEFLGESGISEASLNTKFAINKGNSNLLNAPGSGTIEQQGTVEGWSLAGSEIIQTIYRTFDSPKLLNGTFSVVTRCFPNNRSWVHLEVHLVLNDDTEIQVLNRQIPGYQDVWNTDTYTFTEPKLVKSVKMYTHILGNGSFSIQDILFTEIISVSTAKTLFFNVSSEEELTYTNAVSNSRTVDFLDSIDVTSVANGTYKIALPNTGTQPTLFSNNVFITDSTPIAPININSIGNPTVNDGIYSYANTTNYLTLPKHFNPANNTWEMVWKFKQNGDINFLGCGGANYGGLIFGVLNNKTFLYLSSLNSSWNIANNVVGITTLNTDSDYYARLKFTGTQYIVNISTTGEFNGEETTENIINSSNAIYQPNELKLIGGNKYNNGGNIDIVLNGTINLEESYIKIDNQIWWTYKDDLTGDVWLNPQEPYSAKQYDGDAWVDYNDTILLDGSITVSNGVIEEVKQPTYNYNGIGLNQSSKSNVEYLMQLPLADYKRAYLYEIRVNTTFTAPCNGKVNGGIGAGTNAGSSFIDIYDENGNLVNSNCYGYSGADVNQYYVDIYLPKGFSMKAIPSWGGDTYYVTTSHQQINSKLQFIPLKGEN